MSIGSFFGRMFGSPKAMESAIDGVRKGLDEIFYTSEEQAADAAKSITEARSMFLGWMDKTQGQNIARRFLAMLIAFTWLGQFLTAQALSLAAVWMDDPKKIMTSANLVGENADSMTGAMMLILGFYFAAPHLGKVVDVAMSKFGKT